MKKVININFQGQVIAIEETAYEILNRYIVSLKSYFSKEEDGDEIVNDIENRIAELFGNRLKLGINCITDDDVEAIINSIGRPEEFDTEYDEESQRRYEVNDNFGGGESKSTADESLHEGSKSLYRNANEKIIGGVCSGLAHYFKTDPAWFRLGFLVFFGILFWVYIILWIVLKEKHLESNVSRRLYRNPNDKYIGGVCGGIAAYFKIDSWIPRLIFLLPLFFNVFGMVTIFPLSHLFGDMDFNWSMNGSMVLLYIILMIIVPEAKSVKQKLEMMGEDEYIKSIRDRVNDNLASSKTRAGDSNSIVNDNTRVNSGDDLKAVSEDNLQKVKYSNMDDSSKISSSSDTGNSSEMNTNEMPPEPPYTRTGYSRTSAKPERSGCLNTLIILIKVAFFSFVGIVALSMIALFAGLFFAGAQLIPLKSLFIDPGYESTLLTVSLILLILVPIVAIITWIVRRVMKAKSRPAIGVIATVLWLAGVVLSVVLTVKVVDKFSVESSRETTLTMAPLSSNKLYVEMDPYREDYAEFKFGWGIESDLDELPFTNIEGDSLLFRDINVFIRQSNDSLFNVRVISAIKGKSLKDAKEATSEFGYNIVQNDSVLLLPEFLRVPVSQGYRDQSVTVEISVPAGKSVEVSDALSEYRDNEPPSVARKRIRSYNSSYTPYVPATNKETF